MRRIALTAAIALILPLIAGCGADKEPVCDAEVLGHQVYGFNLGESKRIVLEEARAQVRVERLPDPPGGPRGELYRLSAPLVDIEGIDNVRLTFLDGCLMEVIVYFRDTTVSTLYTLRRRFEEWYGVEATSPDGTIEMAYKTYWLKAPGMSVTIRRITKKPKTELYVQFLHNELDARYRERKASRERELRVD